MSVHHSNGLRTETQFSIFLINKPGVLARVCRKLAAEKINILGLSMHDSTEHGVLRVVVDDADNARAALNDVDLPRTETIVLAATLPNRAGVLADVVERLASEHVNVHYAYCTTGSAGGKTLGFFKVSNLAKAMQILEERKPRRRSQAIRPDGRSRLR